MPISRRTLLTQLGSLSAAGLLIGPALAETVPFTPLPTNQHGKGRKAAVVGAGIAGLSAAYELHKAGFDVTLLEARQRVGGRSWTLRGGDRVQHDDDSEQHVAFAEGLYFNPGPARIMSHHRTILGYCRELGVALEPLINDSRNALLLPNLAQPAITQRQARQDLKGRLSELLLQHIPSGQPDELRDLLLAYGDLDGQGSYTGSLRSAEVDFPRLEKTPTRAPTPLDWPHLLDPQLRAALIEDAVPEYAASMFQPVGGMDRIAQAFALHLSGRIRLGAELTALQTGEHGSLIKWREAGREHSLQADYLIVALPLPLLAKVKHNLPNSVQRVLATRHSQQANKVAWQAPRFWERNDHIYGGLSRLNHEAQLLWYPSDGFNSEQGVLIGAYNQGEVAKRFAQLPLAEQYARSRQAVDALHPGQGNSLQAPVTVNWARIPYSQGSWPLDDDDGPNPLLSQAYGRTWLAGDGIAYGGQEGAADSGRRAVAAIVQHAAGASA